MIVKTFLQTAHNFKEQELLMRFHESIPDDIVDFDLEKLEPTEIETSLEQSDGYSNCDVAIMFGSWKGREKGHHISRTSVMQNSKCFLVFETPLINRTTDGTHRSYRLGMNHFLNNAGTFLPPQQNYSNDRLLNVWRQKFRGWKANKNRGKNILLLMQLPGDASLKGTNMFHWTYDAVKELREHTDRPIVLRPHPMNNLKDGDAFYEMVTKMFIEKIPNISISDSKNTTIYQDLDNAYCSVAFTSGSSVDSIIAGVPVIAADPGNFAFEISSHFMSDVETVFEAPASTVEQWLNNLAHHQWTVEEISDGTAWKHMYPIIYNKLRSIKVEETNNAAKGKRK